MKHTLTLVLRAICSKRILPGKETPPLSDSTLDFLWSSNRAGQGSLKLVLSITHWREKQIGAIENDLKGPSGQIRSASEWYH
jgi:hypothetical protein